MDILNYVVKRVLQMIPVFVIVTILIFALMRLIPGDPALVMLGEKANPTSLAALREKMGLNHSMIYQFFVYLRDLLHFDLGTSITYTQPVGQLIAQRLGVTLILTLVSTIFSVLISFFLGYLSGIHKDRLPDYLVRIFALIGLSTPAFWIGLMLLTLFAVKIQVFPVAGWGDTVLDHLRGIILPSLTQAIGVSAVLIRNLRNNVVDIKDSDFVDFAKSKGLKKSIISRSHIIRNAMIPTTTLLSIRVIGMLSGSIVIETVFSLPGVGALLVNGIYDRDYPVIQGVVLVFVIIVMLINLVTDILYSILDPRVKLN
jgi:peptide/nickel transport system permease protein